MRILPALLPVLLLTACVSNPERDCGLYDFDCDSTPSGPALIQPDTRASAVAPAGPATASGPDAADLATRVLMLEEETRRLRRRIDALEQGR